MPGFLACAAGMNPWLALPGRRNETGVKQRLFGEFNYAAKTWKNQLRVIARIEHMAKGANPRYIVTNLPGDGQYLYEQIYCARGDMKPVGSKLQGDNYLKINQI